MSSTSISSRRRSTIVFLGFTREFGIQEPLLGTRLLSRGGVKGLCFSPVRVDSPCAQEDQGRSSVGDPYSSVVAGEVVVPGPLGPSGGDSVFASLSSRFGVTTSVRFSTSESGNPPSDCLVGIGERAHSSGFL